MAEDPLTFEDVRQIEALMKNMGEDCLIITARDLGEKLGLDPAGLCKHLKDHFNSHHLRSVLAGKESVGPCVLILYVPADYSGDGGVFLFSAKQEYAREYLKFKSEPPGRIN